MEPMYPDTETLRALYAEVLRLRESLERISGSSQGIQVRMIETKRFGQLRSEKPEEKKATSRVTSFRTGFS
jgi:hypothetical protein